MSTAGKDVAVIGAGAMGLAAAYWLLKRGHKVTVYEGGSVAGGMAAHFDFDGLSIERFYHFVCQSDAPLFDLMQELGMGDAMHWRATTMGFYHDGRLQDWGNPVALLRFRGLSLIAKLRYGLHAFVSTKRSDWRKLDDQYAHTWLRRWVGEEAYRVCWERLIHLKFFGYSDKLSAAWIWTRIKRIGTSRKSLFEERLGHIEGGSETLVTALVSAIEGMGGTVHLGQPVERIVIEDNAVVGVQTAAGTQPHDAAIATVAIPYIVDILRDLPQDLIARYRALPNIGVVCVVHKLARPVTGHFWVNINDPRIDVPGIIEFSNLRDTGDDHVVYVPYYMPQDHPKFGWDNAQFEEETRAYLKLVNPDLQDSDFLACQVGRLRYAQPVCGPNFLADLPPIAPGVKGLQVADTSYYYPEDRGISESVRLARQMADAV